MTNTVFWSERAKSDYKGILNYLHQNWSARELSKFAIKIEQHIGYLISNPEIGTLSKKKAVRRLIISKQTSVYYKIIHGDIYIIALFDNRQNPYKLKSL